MKKLITICAVVAMVLTVSGVARATSLSMDITGVIEAPGSAVVDDWMQVGPIGSNDNTGTPFAWGTIDSYSASSDLPQNAGDLDKYGWAMTGTITSIVDHTIYSSGDGWMLAPDYGFDTEAEYLEKFAWTMACVYVDDWSSGIVTGTLTAEVGDRQPAGWPEAVDWSAANPGTLTGSFNSSTNTLTATVVPEPGTICMLGLGAFSLILIRRRRKA